MNITKEELSILLNAYLCRIDEKFKVVTIIKDPDYFGYILILDMPGGETRKVKFNDNDSIESLVKSITDMIR